jgi:membrane protease subunit HflK
MDEAQPPEEVQDAFEDAIKAREDEQRIINEANAYRNDVVPKARGEGRGLIEQAEAYKTRVIESALGETSRFNQLLAEYQRAPEVTRERLYLDAIESVMARSPKVMVDVEGGNNLMFLPLDQLMGRAGTSGSPLNNLGSGTGDSSSLIDEFKRNASRNRDRETRQ